MILVGHNINFDYNFLRKEFGEFQYDFKRPLICTVKLSRKLLPGRKSYALGKLTQDLGIKNKQSHRALGDVKATVQLFEKLLKIESEITSVNVKGLNSNVSQKIISGLPRAVGVYYFLNNKHEIIYVGKSINIHDRVMSHLVNNTNKRAVQMRSEIEDVHFELCGNELIALLKESFEIKKYTPLYNRAQRRKLYQWGLYEFIDEHQYLNLRIKRNNNDEVPLTSFRSKEAAKNRVFDLVEEYGLCQKLCNLYVTQGPCFHYKLKRCNGACIQEEDSDVYNQRVEKAILQYRYIKDNFLIIGEGRNDGEQSVVIVQNGKYLGYGFLDLEVVSTNQVDELINYIDSYPDNKDVQQIIRSYMNYHPKEKVIYY